MADLEGQNHQVENGDAYAGPGNPENRADDHQDNQGQGADPAQDQQPVVDTSGKIFVGGVAWQTTDDGLRYYFERYGELLDVALMKDKATGAPRGFGFVTFKDGSGK